MIQHTALLRSSVAAAHAVKQCAPQCQPLQHAHALFLAGGGLPPARMLYRQNADNAADTASKMPDGTGAQLAATRNHI
jgi:hypothetical protein